MGRIIDRFVLTVVIAACLYIFFMSAFGSIPLASASAFLAMAAIKKLTKLIPPRSGKNVRKNIDAEIERMTYQEKSQVEKRVRELIKKAYSDTDDDMPIIVIQNHPAYSKLTADDLLAVWRGNIGKEKTEKIVIVSLAKASDEIHAVSASLINPRTRLIDGSQLAQLMRKFPPDNSDMPNAKPTTGKFSRIVLAAKKVSVKRCLLSGLFMCALFMISNKLTYIVAGCASLFLAGCGLRRRKIPETLFDERL